MHTQRTANRRRVLTAIGVGTGVTLAGCLTEGNGDDDTGDGDTGDDDAGDDDTGDDSEDEIEFPTEDLRIIAPFGPGGGFDTVARMAAPLLSEALDVDNVVENIQGGNGAFALDEIYNAEPDGHTLGVADDWMYSNQLTMEVDHKLEELTYYGQVEQTFTSLVVGADTDMESWEDFVDEFNAGDVLIGAPNPSASGIQCLYRLGEWTGDFDEDDLIENLVIYEDAGQWYTGLSRGDIQALAIDHTSNLPYEEAGELRTIVAFRAQDDPPDSTPHAQTLADLDLTDDEAEIVEATGSAMRTFCGPPDVPEAETRILRETFEEVLNSDEFIEGMEDADMPLNYASGEETAEAMVASGDAARENLDLIEYLREEAGQ